MTKQTINVGTTANDKKGDSLRLAFQKVNANFTELYVALGLDSGGLNLGAFEFTGSTISTTDSSAITIDQSVTVSSDLIVGGDIVPSTANGGNLGSTTNPFKSLYVSSSTVYFNNVPLAINQSGQLTVNGSQVGGSVAWNDVTGKPTIPSIGDTTFTNSTVSAGNEDEIIIQAKDTNGFSSARLNLEPVYGNAQLSAYSTETVETFTIANGDFATGIWQNNGFGNGVVAFTGAQNIGDFFQNTLMSLTPENVSITINSEPAITWNGGTNGSGTDTPGFGTNPTVPASPIAITSIVFRYRSQSFVSVNQDSPEIRLKAQNANIRMDADLNIQMFSDNQIEIQSGDTLSISAGESISISNGSNDTISISTGDLNITAFDDVNFRGSDSFRIRNTSATAPIRIITDDNNTQRTWAFNPDGNLTLPGNLQSEGDISIEINLADSTRRIWRFGEDGDLRFPDGTVQTTAFAGTASSLVNGANTVSLESDGTLTLPGTGTIRTAFGAMSINAPAGLSNLSIKSSDTTTYMIVGNGSAGITVGAYNWQFSNTGNLTFPDSTIQTTAWTGNFGYLTAEKDAIRGTAGYQYTFNTDGYFTASTSSESPNYFFVAYNATNSNIAAGWTVVGGTANTTVSSVTYPVAGYPGVIRVNLTAAASSTSGFYPVTVTSPDRLRVEIQPNPGTSDKFAFTTSGLTFPDATVQTTAYAGPQTTLVGAVDNNVLIRTSETVVTNNLYTNTVDFSTDVDIGGGTIISGWTQRNAEQIEISLFGPADFRTYLTGLSLGRTVTVTYSTAGGNQTLTRPLTQIFASVAQEDPSNPGWYRVAGRIDATLPAGQTGIVSVNFPVTTTPQRDWTFSDTGSLTFPDASVQTTAYTGTANLATVARNIENEGDVNIRVNLTDSTTRIWRFGEDGDLAFPDGTTQTTAFAGNAATVDITNTNGIDTNYSITFVETRDATQILRADVDLTFNSATNLLTAGNVTTGVLKIEDGVHEKFQALADAIGTVTHDCASGHIFYHTSPDNNWTANFTNLNLDSGYATAVTLIIVQGATGYYPGTVRIDGAVQLINWPGGILPTPSINRIDVVTFSIINNSGTYTVLGQLTGF